MENVKEMSEVIKESNNSTVPRNSEMFGEWLESIGWSYPRLYVYFNKLGITEFNKYFDESGNLTPDNNVNSYSDKRAYHSADNGNRTPAELDLDCAVGNMQETLFCLENPEFMRNPKATNTKNKNNVTTRELDLIHIKSGEQVEFKMRFDKVKDCNYLWYKHRDSRFKDFLRNGNKIMIYYPYYGLISVFGYKDFVDEDKGKKNGHIWYKYTEKDKNGKEYDKITIGKRSMITYRMLQHGNANGILNKFQKIN